MGKNPYIDENTGCADIAMETNNPRIMYAGMWTFRRKPWRFDDGGKHSALQDNGWWTNLEKNNEWSSKQRYG